MIVCDVCLNIGIPSFDIMFLLSVGSMALFTVDLCQTRRGFKQGLRDWNILVKRIDSTTVASLTATRTVGLFGIWIAFLMLPGDWIGISAMAVFFLYSAGLVVNNHLVLRSVKREKHADIKTTHPQLGQ